jgi:hypothetical protein
LNYTSDASATFRALPTVNTELSFFILLSLQGTANFSLRERTYSFHTSADRPLHNHYLFFLIQLSFLGLCEYTDTKMSLSDCMHPY